MNRVFFRCKRSGNVVSFTLQGDIDGMRNHEGYVELRDDQSPSVPAAPQPQGHQPVMVVPRRRGRPARS